MNKSGTEARVSLVLRTMGDKALRLHHILRPLEDNENEHVMETVRGRARTINATWARISRRLLCLDLGMLGTCDFFTDVLGLMVSSFL